MKELERAQDELGLTGIVITDFTEPWGLPPLSHPHWDPLWDAAQSRGVPVNFHIGSGGGPMRLWGSYPPARAFAALSTMAQMGNLVCIVNLISSGLLDRFPRLNFVSVESGIGWLPFMLESLDYQFVENGVDDLKLRPTEYFRRQIYGSYWFESNPEPAIDWIGEDNLMFETDFPHATCLYPGVKETKERSLKGLAAARAAQAALRDRGEGVSALGAELRGRREERRPWRGIPPSTSSSRITGCGPRSTCSRGSTSRSRARSTISARGPGTSRASCASAGPTRRSSASTIRRRCSSARRRRCPTSSGSAPISRAGSRVNAAS